MDPVDVDAVRTREDLATVVLALREDLLANHAAWENPTLDRFLKALAAWCPDMPGYRLNSGVEQPEQPGWNLVARMLMAASVYE
jgi:hypothetical protein